MISTVGRSKKEDDCLNCWLLNFLLLLVVSRLSSCCCFFSVVVEDDRSLIMKTMLIVASQVFFLAMILLNHLCAYSICSCFTMICCLKDTTRPNGRERDPDRAKRNENSSIERKKESVFVELSNEERARWVFLSNRSSSEKGLVLLIVYYLLLIGSTKDHDGLLKFYKHFHILSLIFTGSHSRYKLSR